ncbi:MAG: hypothetical protein WBD34_15715 [Burkholderiaceae bacterium]
MFFKLSSPATGEPLGGRKPFALGRFRAVRAIGIAVVFPLMLSACGETDYAAVSASGSEQMAISPNAGSAPTKKSDSGQDFNPGSLATAETINSLDTIVDDMALMNDLPLIGADPAYGFASGPGFTIMGNNPSGANLPDWFVADNPELADSGYWQAIIPWFVLFEGQGNSAQNVRVQLRNLKLYILSRSTNQWRELIGAQDVGGEFCPQGNSNQPCTRGNLKQAESTGGASITPVAGYEFLGWFGNRTAIDGEDIKAVFVTLQGRLIVNDLDAPDDRRQARYLIDVGADYYVDTEFNEAYVPGVGVSRAKLISTDWQPFNFMTFSDVGIQDPGGGISEQEMRENPPPLQ